MKRPLLTTAEWIEERATTLGTNARGRFVHSMNPKAEVSHVVAQCHVALWQAVRRGRREAVALAAVIGAVLGGAVGLLVAVTR